MKNVLLALCFGIAFVDFSYAAEAQVILCGPNLPCPNGLVCDLQQKVCVPEDGF